MPSANLSTNPSPTKATWATGWPQWLVWMVTGVVLLILPAVILEALISDKYLPSIEWLQASRPAVYGLWLVWGLAILLAVLRSGGSVAMRVFVSVVCIAIFAPSVGNLVRSSIPALIATISGTDVQHTFRVIRADGSSGKFCRTPVELEDMPFMTKLCGVGSNFRASLSPGQTVVFRGQGTWMGLYVQ